MNLMQEKKLFLLDMDGTIYLDNCLLDGAMEFITYLLEHNIDYMFLTNNSSKSTDAYLQKLHRLGIPAERDNFFTSGQASCLYLQRLKPGASIYVMGTESLKAEVRSYGFTVVETYRPVDFLLVGYDTELTYQKLTDACNLLCDGTPFYATNPDVVCPAEGGRYLPDCATMCYMLEKATGKQPFYIGKPRKEMALEAIASKHATPEQTALVGDRLYTDIQCGINAGITSVLVLSGESTLADIEKYNVHPSVIVEHIGKLLD